jgi:hypothetical protein
MLLTAIPHGFLTSYVQHGPNRWKHIHAQYIQNGRINYTCHCNLFNAPAGDCFHVRIIQEGAIDLVDISADGQFNS